MEGAHVYVCACVCARVSYLCVCVSLCVCVHVCACTCVYPLALDDLKLSNLHCLCFSSDGLIGIKENIILKSFFLSCILSEASILNKLSL